MDYGEVVEAEVLTLSDKPFSLCNLDEHDCMYTVEVCVSDDDTTTCDSLIVTVDNGSQTFAAYRLDSDFDTDADTSHPSYELRTVSGVKLGDEVQNVAQIYAALDFTPDDVVVSWLPLYHDMGLIAGFLLPLLQVSQPPFIDHCHSTSHPLALHCS